MGMERMIDLFSISISTLASRIGGGDSSSMLSGVAVTDQSIKYLCAGMLEGKSFTKQSERFSYEL